MKHVLVTGASGFIGHHCLQVLCSAGYVVHAISSKHNPIQTPGVTWHKLDLFDWSETAALVERLAATHMVHLAWSFGPGGSDSAAKGQCPYGYQWVQASLNLVRHFVEAGGERAVVAGTCFEYDWSNGNCSEFTTIRQPITYYGVCKNALNEVLTGYAEAVGLSLAWPRIFFLYGPHEPETRLVASVVRSLLLGQPALCSPGTQVRDYLYVKDVSEAICAILDSSVEGPINIGSQQPIEIRNLVMTAAEMLGRRELLKLGAIPPRPNDAAVVLADTSRLRNAVGWQPRFSVAQGLAETIDWWRKELRQPSGKLAGYR